MLIVNNFTRVSAPAWFDTPDYAGFTDNLDSGVPWGKDILLAGPVNEFARDREWTDNGNPGFGGCFTTLAGSQIAGNSFDFVARHGQAVLAAGYAFDSSSSEAFTGRSDAFALDLICGKQVTTRIGRGAVPDRYPVFPEALQDALRRYTSNGGNIIVSGSYIGTDVWDAVYQGVPRAPQESRNFVQEVLGYKWLTNFGDNAGIVLPAKGSRMPEASYNREWSSRYYRVENPDGIEPASAKTSVLYRYKGSHVPAATWYNANSYKVAAFGFPLETSPQMADILQATLKRF